MIMKKYGSNFGAVMLPSLLTVMACDISKSPNLFHVKRSLRVDVEHGKLKLPKWKGPLGKENDVEMRNYVSSVLGVRRWNGLIMKIHLTHSTNQDVGSIVKDLEKSGQNLD